MSVNNKPKTQMSNTTLNQPIIEVKSDYEGYFESLVRSWIAKKQGPLKHSKFIVSAGPYRSSVVTYKMEGDTIHLDFYAAYRRGFGELSNEEVNQIIDLL